MREVENRRFTQSLRGDGVTAGREIFVVLGSFFLSLRGDIYGWRLEISFELVPAVGESIGAVKFDLIFIKNRFPLDSLGLHILLDSVVHGIIL